jgi:tRNA G18 (ribose-2'-O)-methylase SpoU
MTDDDRTAKMYRRQYWIVNNIQKRKNIRDLLLSASAFGVAEVFVVGQKLLSFESALNFADMFPDFALPFPITRCLTLQDCRTVLKGRHPNMIIVGIEILSHAFSVNDPRVFPENGPSAFMVGNEGSGLSDAQLAICDSFVYIPQYGYGTASLNVTVAASIVMHSYAVWAYELARGDSRG